MDMITHGRPLVNQSSALVEISSKHSDRSPPFWKKRIVLGSNLDSTLDRQRCLPLCYFPAPLIFCVKTSMPIVKSVFFSAAFPAAAVTILAALCVSRPASRCHCHTWPCIRYTTCPFNCFCLTSLAPSFCIYIMGLPDWTPFRNHFPFFVIQPHIWWRKKWSKSPIQRQLSGSGVYM